LEVSRTVQRISLRDKFKTNLPVDCKRVDYDWLALSGCEVTKPLNEDQHCCSLFVLNSGMHADSYEVPKDRDLGDLL